MPQKKRDEIEYEAKKRALDIKFRKLERQKERDALRAELEALENPLNTQHSLSSIPIESSEIKVARFVSTSAEAAVSSPVYKDNSLAAALQPTVSKQLPVTSPPVLSIPPPVTVSIPDHIQTHTLPSCSQTPLTTFADGYLRSVNLPFVPAASASAHDAVTVG